MSRDIAPFGLRMKPELKEALDRSAKENKRSLNAEISSRLESTLSDCDNLFVSADDARKLASESRIQLKDRILTTAFEHIHAGINSGKDVIWIHLDDYHLDEVSEDISDELLEPTFNKLKELGYDFEVLDIASIRVLL
jgi:hypothetical protein